MSDSETKKQEKIADTKRALDAKRASFSEDMRELYLNFEEYGTNDELQSKLETRLDDFFEDLKTELDRM